MAPTGICVPGLGETSQPLFCDPLSRITMWENGSFLPPPTTTPTTPKAAGKGSWPQLITSHTVTHMGVGHSLRYVTPSSREVPRKSHCSLSCTAPGTCHGRKQGNLLPSGSCIVLPAGRGRDGLYLKSVTTVEK